MNTNNNNLQNLLGTGATNGDVDPTAANFALTIAKGNPKISNLGVSVDDIVDSEAITYHMLIDDSSSLSKLAQYVRDGQKEFLDILMKSRKKSNIMVAIDCLNNDGNIDLPYSLLVDNAGNLAIPYLDTQNYNPRGGTPLYDRAAEAATQMLAKIQQIRQAGLQEKSFLMIISDGADLHSRKYSAQDVKSLVDEILKSETNSVFAIGIDDGNTDFNAVFTSMGVPKDKIWTPSAMDPKAILRAIQEASQSASASASATAAGGFGS